MIAQPGDVVPFDGAIYTLAFDASANGVPPGTITDAVSSLGPGDFLLSFDVTTEIAGITSHDEDLVRFHAGGVMLFLDGSATRVPDGVDIDAVHCLDRNGHLLISFDGTGAVPGVIFDDEDVLEYEPAAGLWELSYDGSAEHAWWSGADLEAVAATTTEGTATPPIVGFMSGQGTQVGVALGSTRVFGTGTADAKPEDGCIAIYEVGANGTPDQPPGSVFDNELLDTGGTDAGGAFVDANLESAPASWQLNPALRTLNFRGRQQLRQSAIVQTCTPPPLARSVSLWRTLHPMHYSMVGTISSLRTFSPPRRRLIYGRLTGG